jgi:hypothetical protein
MQGGFMGPNSDLPPLENDDEPGSHYAMGEGTIKQSAPARSRPPTEQQMSKLTASKEMSINKFNEISAPPRMSVQNLWPDAQPN